MFYCKDIYSICHVNIYIYSYILSEVLMFYKEHETVTINFFSLLSFAIQIESLNVRFQLIFGL